MNGSQTKMTVFNLVWIYFLMSTFKSKSIKNSNFKILFKFTILNFKKFENNFDMRWIFM